MPSVTIDPSEMHVRLVAYFTGEKRESVLFVLAGLVGLVAAAALFRGVSAYRGMIVPLVLFGAIQVAVGGSILLRSDGQIATLTAQLAQDPAAVRRVETPRMEKVMANFGVYKIVEILVLVAGVVLVMVFRHGTALHAGGIGCIAQGSLMLVLDLFAEGRGHEYLAALAQLP